jgi:radical SAM protein with 4Fe4S-binding SPASM domain
MDCPRIPLIPYGEFSERLHCLADLKRLPLSASLELTARCNLRCAHCYTNLAANAKEARKRELDLAHWAPIIDGLVAEGCLWLLITGGEPLLRPDFPDFYLYAKQQGMILTLFTNGTLMTPELADFLQEWPPFVIEITIYGRTETTYEAATRTRGSYEKCLRGIELLLARGIPLDLKATITTVNVHELEEMKSWARDLGVEFRFDPVLHPRLDGGKEPLAQRLAPEQVADLDLSDAPRRREFQELAKNFRGRVDTDFLYDCGAGSSSCHLDPYGRMFPCLLCRTTGFDLTRGSFKEGWRKFLPGLIRRKPQGDYRCGRCDLLLFCNRCPAWAQMEEGNEEAPVDYLCRLARLRARIFNQDL